MEQPGGGLFLVDSLCTGEPGFIKVPWCERWLSDREWKGRTNERRYKENGLRAKVYWETGCAKFLEAFFWYRIYVLVYNWPSLKTCVRI